MSNESNNNDEDEIKTKTTVYAKEKESINVSRIYNSPERKVRINSRRFSMFEISKLPSSKEDATDSTNIEKINREALKKGLNKRITVLSKKKKGKKIKKKEQEPVLLTEVKQRNRINKRKRRGK